MKSRLKIWIAIAGGGIVIFLAILGIVSLFRDDPPHVYIVAPNVELFEGGTAASVSVFNCGNVAFEQRRQAEKYSRETPGTHVFEVSFRMIH